MTICSVVSLSAMVLTYKMSQTTSNTTKTCNKCTNFIKTIKATTQFVVFLFVHSWEQRKLGDVGTTFTGLSGKTKEDFGHGNAGFVTYMNVFSNPIADLTQYEKVEIDSKQAQVKYGDIFFTTSSETPEEVGMSSIWLGKQPNIYLNSFCFGYRPSIPTNPYYLGFMLRSASVRKKFILLAQGISRYNISKNKAMEIVVSIPSDNEQEKVGTFFKEIDNLITLHQCECLGNSHALSILPSPLSSRKMTSFWELRKLGEVSPLRGGFAFKSEEYLDAGIPVVRISNILTDGTVGADFAYYNRIENDENMKLHNGDAVLAMSGATTGKVSILHCKNDDIYYQNQRVGYFTYNKNYDYKYISIIVRSPKFIDQLSSVLVAGAQPNVSSKDIESFEFKFPTEINEQSKIGKLFEQLDNLITLHQRECLPKTCSLASWFYQQTNRKMTSFWEQRKVSEMFKVTRGYVLASTLTGAVKTDKKPYPVYSSQTKDNGLMGYYKDYLYEDAITWTTDGANAGTVNYRDGKFYCTNVCGVLLSNEVTANQMIAEALNNVAKGYVSYVGNPKLMNNVMADIEIMIPTQSDEREKLSVLFRNLDNLITLHQRQLEKLKNIKSALLEKMFV